jgi:hypothetical protein
MDVSFRYPLRLKSLKISFNRVRFAILVAGINSICQGTGARVSSQAHYRPATSAATPAVGPGVNLLPVLPLANRKNATRKSLTAAHSFANGVIVAQSGCSSAHQRGGREFGGSGCQGGSHFLPPANSISRHDVSLSPLKKQRAFNKTSAVPFCTTPHMRHPSRVVPSDQAF